MIKLFLKFKPQNKGYSMSNRLVKPAIAALRRATAAIHTNKLKFRLTTAIHNLNSLLIRKKSNLIMLNILSSYNGPKSSGVLSEELNSNEILKSEIPFNILDLISKYQDFLNTLDLDQIVAMFNIIGYGTLLMILSNIHLTSISNKILEKYNLEQRFPRLKKLLEIRQSLANKYLKFNIGLLYMYILLFILGNLYMLGIKFFS